MGDGGYFYVTGLPRTGTAWLANYFTYGGVACVHEPLRFVRAGDLTEWMRVQPFRLGLSDSALPFYWERLAPELREAPILLVERPAAVVIPSLAQAFGLPTHVAEAIVVKTGEALGVLPKDQVLAVPYESLWEEEVMERVCAHLGVPFYRDRLMQLSSMRVTVIPDAHYAWMRGSRS